VRRVLRSEFASGIVDHPTAEERSDVLGGSKRAKIEERGRFAEESGGVLPWTARR